jgi:release factor glutamine methyltransferase
MRELVNQISKDFAVTKGEAELILATLLDRPRFEIYLNNKIDDTNLKLLKTKLLQLKKGVPIEYITKKVHFLNYVFRVYPGVFIPRLETEYFTELIEKIPEFTPQRILEIGTGCGAISIVLAAVFPHATLTATDVSDIALSCARGNIEKYKLQKRITLKQCNLFDGITETFDLIVSNPPYIPRARLESLPKSVKEFEPIVAINGGEGGLQFIYRLVGEGMCHLKRNGIMALEIDEDEVSPLQEYLSSNISVPFSFKKDLFGRFRYLFIGNSENEKNKNNS